MAGPPDIHFLDLEIRSLKRRVEALEKKAAEAEGKCGACGAEGSAVQQPCPTHGGAPTFTCEKCGTSFAVAGAEALHPDDDDDLVSLAEFNASAQPAAEKPGKGEA